MNNQHDTTHDSLNVRKIAHTQNLEQSNHANLNHKPSPQYRRGETSVAESVTMVLADFLRRFSETNSSGSQRHKNGVQESFFSISDQTGGSLDQT